MRAKDSKQRFYNFISINVFLVGYLRLFSFSEQKAYSFLRLPFPSKRHNNKTANREKSPISTRMESNSQSNDYTFCFSYIFLLFTCRIRFPPRCSREILKWIFFLHPSHMTFFSSAPKNKTRLTLCRRKTSHAF